MISLRRPLLALLALVAAPVLLAQTLPTLTQPFTARSLLLTEGSVSIDLRAHFGLPTVTGQVVQIETVAGSFNIELFDDTPLTKANFLAYVNSGRYTNTIVHRSVPGPLPTDPKFVIQTGGYFSRLPFEHIPTFAAVNNEFRRSNLRGTLAMAKLGNDPNSATSEWFVNLGDNSANLDNQNGGFTVFGRVLGSGMLIADAIAAFPRFNIAGSLSDLPLRDVAASQANVETRNLITVSNVLAIPIYPPATRSVLTFLAQSSDPTVVGVAVSGSTLTLTPLTNGTSVLLIRARDTNNNFADASLVVTVSSGFSIVTPPQSQHVQPAAPALLSVTAAGTGVTTYQWNKNGVPIVGATGAAYLVVSASAADMGFYSATVTRNGTSVTSTPAIVTVNLPGTSRLVNVSTRGQASADEPLTPGFVMRGTGTKRLVIRAIGPTLGVFGVNDAMTDPKMAVIPLSQTNVVLANDDWQSQPAAAVSTLIATSGSVGAFALPPLGSKDAAAVASLPVSGVGGYTVGITPSGSSGPGVALAEIYDADAADSAVRMINVSTLGTVTADGLTPGFVIGGSAPKQLLIRAVGPTLASAFGVTGTVPDPQLTIFDQKSSVAIASNNDWAEGGQGAALQAAFDAAGAFALPTGSKDAAILVRLPPGAYTVVASGVNGGTGRALVEVYDLDP